MTVRALEDFARGAGLLAVLSAALLLAACGDGDDDAGQQTAQAEVETPVVADPVVEEPDAPAMAAEAPDAVEEPGTYEPGPLRFRVVNLLDDPVDVYVRTTGLVRAFPVDIGVAPGVTTDFHAPPEGGRFVITTAGAGDATCVASCPHFISDDRLYAEDGDTYTVIVYDDGGSARTMRLWETAPAERIGQASNAMVPAAADAGIVVVTAVALTEADFGLWLAFVGEPGCQSPTNLGGNILVGGNQTPAFTYAGDAVEAVLHGNQDRDCTGQVQGGPFTIAGGPGTRTHLILTGSPGAMEATILPMAEAQP